MIEKLYLHLVEISVFVGLMYGVMKSNASLWALLARAYRADDGLSCDHQRTMQTVILVGGKVGWNSYNGIVTVGVTREGISLRLLPPFSLFHSPLLIPYREIQIEPRRWYLIGKTSQLTLNAVSDVQVIVHDELLQWIESQAMKATSVSLSRPALFRIRSTPPL
jgi:hypothetical protein